MTQKALRDLKSFLQENEELIEDIRDGAKSLVALNDKLDQHRQDADALLSQINNLSFAPAPDEDVRKRQRALLEKIEQLSKEISTHADDPELLILFFAQRGDLWFALGNTFNEAAGSIITFSTQEVDELIRAPATRHSGRSCATEGRRCGRCRCATLEICVQDRN